MFFTIKKKILCYVQRGLPIDTKIKLIFLRLISWSTKLTLNASRCDGEMAALRWQKNPTKRGSMQSFLQSCKGCLI